MKANKQRRGKGKKHNDKLHKFMVSVNNYVKSHGGGEEATHDQGPRFIKRKSRKELRKEKRKMKKAKMKCHYMGKQHPSIVQVPEPANEAKQGENVKEAKKAKETTKKGSEPPQKSSRKQPENSADGVREKLKRKNDSKKVSFKEPKKAKMEESRKRALLEANVAEDREIKKLERQLGLSKRKNKQTLPQSFTNDGLDYILGILEPGAAATGLYDSDDDMGLAKDQIKNLEDESDAEMESEAEEDDDISEKSEDDSQDYIDDGKKLDTIVEEDEDEENEMNEEEEDDEDGEEEEDELEGGDEEDEELMEEDDEESPAIAGKYIPPHLREAADSKRKAELERLKRTVKGLLNRLSEPNMGSISSQLEELYMNCSRKDMNDTLTDVLLAACVTSSLMPDRLLMEHILLVSVLHHTVGLEVGAHFLETVVRRFDEEYRHTRDDDAGGKECDNLVAMVAHLYNFQVVHSLLIFDLLKRLVDGFTSKDMELVLFLLKNVGFALRKDDPLALKELIAEAQKKASAAGPKFQDQTRVRFMLETMLALKNNDMRKIPGYNPEPVEKLRKLQRSLIHHSSSGSDVKLRVTLQNLLEAEEVGRWWIVGSSWSGAPMIGDQGNKTTPQPVAGSQFSAKVLELARKQRMNTDIRRNIFCVLMTSEDYLDAFEKLLRLGLKDQQERDIVHVLLDCCLQEKSFNAFYAVLGEKFCSHDRRFQMTFQFSLWDKFKDLANLSSSSFSNLVQLVTHFLHRKCLSLSILKAIEFGELDKPKVKFLKQVLIKLLKETEPEDLINIFGRISGIPKLGMLREGLKLFISHFLLKNAQALGTAEQSRLLTERAEVASKAMEARDTKLKL
ncbi:nucleolar MIF4G domain-containing protein 1 [Chanos chanos]|uniref:Nucleolar MIF4G domain-containing protein 1 n=1 Tax=Chanos chanos TaxID=29144 RepID=A0A6J2VWS8_CHACN|nr:nucleolar MIF4G domain-containing protein 1 [Chanos chanos]